MNIENINRIMKELEPLLKKDKEYRGYKIIDTKSLNPREKGQFFVLLLFFETEDEEKLELYFSRGRKLTLREGLDPIEIHKFYGTMRYLKFS